MVGTIAMNRNRKLNLHPLIKPPVVPKGDNVRTSLVLQNTEVKCEMSKEPKMAKQTKLSTLKTYKQEQ